MPKVVIGNVDCEAQCGDPARRSEGERASSSRVANRMAWFLEAGDVLVTPHPVSPEMLAYIGRFKGFQPDQVAQVSPGGDPSGTILLTEDLIAHSDLILRIGSRLLPGTAYRMTAYFPDPGAGEIARRLGLRVPRRDLAFMLDGRAATLSRKSVFRGLTALQRLPVPPGRICRTEEELHRGLARHLEATGSVLVKQDLAGGGEGNLALTLDPGRPDHPGACRTLLLAGPSALERAAREVWERLVDARNTCLILETFLLDAHPVYAEVDTRGRRTRVLNHGSMRMDPTWVGFEYPVQHLAPNQVGELLEGSRILGEACRTLGYRGLLNCDAVLAGGELYFHEINVRHGGCSHIHAFRRRILGDAPDPGMITENRTPFLGTFPELEQLLEAGDLAFDPLGRRGVVILTEDLARSGTFECLMVAGTHAQALELEDRLLARVGRPGPEVSHDH